MMFGHSHFNKKSSAVSGGATVKISLSLNFALLGYPEWSNPSLAAPSRRHKSEYKTPP
ncbi:MAG: hypothetical protein Q8R53_01305 [Nanoarchaeota archaeon]|nr:hypothetical protein [Nanoarchaeota archaeon]